MSICCIEGATVESEEAPAPGGLERFLGVSTVRPAWDTILWLVGAHGGSGESRLASCDPRWLAADHGWPPASEKATAVVVARSDARGLMAAQRAAQQVADGGVPGVRVAGLVVMADAPGRLPKPLRDLRRIVAGGYARCWSVPWIPQWRTGDVVKAMGLLKAVAALRELSDRQNEEEGEG